MWENTQGSSDSQKSCSETIKIKINPLHLEIYGSHLLLSLKIWSSRVNTFPMSALIWESAVLQFLKELSIPCEVQSFFTFHYPENLNKILNFNSCLITIYDKIGKCCQSILFSTVDFWKILWMFLIFVQFVDKKKLYPNENHL